MLQEAEILFLDPNDVNGGVAALAEHGFSVQILDWVDPHGPLDENQFFDWVASIVAPFGGDVVCAGLADPQQAA
jgi:hypothetical protein